MSAVGYAIPCPSPRPALGRRRGSNFKPTFPERYSSGSAQQVARYRPTIIRFSFALSCQEGRKGLGSAEGPRSHGGELQ
eukprot:scaffold14916_cov128-Isochrysis_galbana.AAC.2